MTTTTQAGAPATKARRVRAQAAALPSSAAVPPGLADLALIDGPSIAATVDVSLTTWHDLVRTGKAPMPAIKGHRCTRWRVADVRAWLIERCTAGTLGA